MYHYICTTETFQSRNGYTCGKECHFVRNYRQKNHPSGFLLRRVPFWPSHRPYITLLNRFRQGVVANLSPPTHSVVQAGLFCPTRKRLQGFSRAPCGICHMLFPLRPGNCNNPITYPPAPARVPFFPPLRRHPGWSPSPSASAPDSLRESFSAPPGTPGGRSGCSQNRIHSRSP